MTKKEKMLLKVFWNSFGYLYSLLISRYSEDNQSDPTDVVIVDLQNTRMGRPGLELAYFFCSSTSPQQRKLHFEELFQYYYDNFFEELKNLGDNSEPAFTLEELKEDFDDCYHYGFVMGCVHSQVKLIKNSFDICTVDAA